MNYEETYVRAYRDAEAAIKEAYRDEYPGPYLSYAAFDAAYLYAAEGDSDACYNAGLEAIHNFDYAAAQAEAEAREVGA
jgi:hypothetical protein